jgi:hypothetical protein
MMTYSAVHWIQIRACSAAAWMLQRTSGHAADRVGCTAHGSDRVNLNSGTAGRVMLFGDKYRRGAVTALLRAGNVPAASAMRRPALFGCAPQGRLPSGV